MPTWLKWTVAGAASGGVYLACRGLGHTPAMVGAIFAFTVVLWITELLPLAVTALLSSALLIVLGGQQDRAVFAAYGNPIILLFIGSFILSKGMELTGLAERFAYFMMSQKWATKSAGSLILALGLVSCLISLIVSNTATTAMMLPIGLAAIRAVPGDSRAFSIALMLMLTWGSSVAVGIPVGTPPNLIGMAQLEKAGVEVGFLQWTAFAMPITLLLLAAAFVVLRILYLKHPVDTRTASEAAVARRAELGRLKASEKVVLAGFVVAMTLWIVPDASVIALGAEHPIAAWLKKHITEAIAALLGASVLFLLPARDRENGRALTWPEAARIDWGIILLFAGGIALGDAMGTSGLAKSLGETAAAATGANSIWTITALCTALAILLSELASNTAAATILCPVAAALAAGAGVHPAAPILGVALGASMGFMLPVSTAPNAIVYASGHVPPKEMLRAGIALDILGFIAIMAGLMTVLPLIGLV